MNATSTLTANVAEPFGLSRWAFTPSPAIDPNPRRRPNARHHVLTLFEDALAHHRAGRISQAVTRYKRALALRPDYADAHNNLGVAFVAQGRVLDAVSHYKRAIALNPDHRNAHSNLGTALVYLGRTEEAIPHYERALTLEPTQADAHYNLGIALAAAGRSDAAILRYQKALFLRHDYAEAHNNLANLLATKGKTDAAIGHYERALVVNPNHAGALNNLGNAYRDLGRFDEAMVYYNRAIAIRPVSAEAHYHRAEIKSFQASDADLAALEALARRDDMPVTKAPFIHFALAKALEDIGDYTRSFHHLRIGNEFKRGQVHYDERAVSQLFSRIAKTFDRDLLDRLRGHGDPSTAPIFVLGMPRSGSTLIEQILASHPQIHGAGELEDLAACLPPGFPESIAGLDHTALGQIGKAYLSRLPVLPEGKLRIVNKLPDNFLRIGLIRLILPNAKIIHTVRNPIDTCLSCYSKLFTNGQNFTYDLGELGRYHRRYSAIMAHWQNVLPSGTIHHVAYEDVVDNLEAEARKLVAYCGLSWDDRCLDFHKNTRVVKTASAVQVRKPLFRTSVERWRKYEAGLIPLLRELTDATAQAA